MPEHKLQIAPDLVLPLDAVTQTFGILAVRGAGKSNTAAVMAEEMFTARLPFVVVDPVGSWYGLRSSSDGKSAGLSIPIFGGKHGDVPLERNGGELIADLVVEKRLSCVLDLSLFESEADKKAFLLAFAKRLYLKNEDPLHLFLEEADDYIPQKPMRDEAQLLRAWENIVRRGRARGLGMTIITQRSAAVSKMVLTQIETLFAMRTTSPQDRAAIEAWVEYHQQGKEIVSSLASLKDGEAWVWSPNFLGQMRRVQIRRRRTFDSGATPKNIAAGSKRAPATMADIDLASLQGRMAATIERAKADDPKELRKRIVELEKQVREATLKEIQTGSIADERRKLVEELAAQESEIRKEAARSVHQRYGEVLMAIAPAVDSLNRALELARSLAQFVDKITEPPRPPLAPVARKIVELAPVTRRASQGASHIGRCERAILTVLAQHRDGCLKSKLALLSGYTYSGGFRNALANLRTNGLIEGGNEELMRITRAGISEIGDYDPLPTGKALHDYWINHSMFGKAEQSVLDQLIRMYPRGATGQELAQLVGYEYSGGFRNALSKLRTAGLITGKSNMEKISASEVMFE